MNTIKMNIKNNNKDITINVVSPILFGTIIIVCIFITIGILILFWQNRVWNTNLPIDNGLFGNYGDFIGGVVGSIIGFYSAYLLVRTFQSQESVNRNVISTNENIKATNEQQQYYTSLEVFDNKFGRFFTSYQNSIYNYALEKDSNKITGRNAFEKLAEEFISTDFENDNDYNRRCNSAVSEYQDFYSKKRLYLAVHFRMLYLLTSLISMSYLKDEDKVLYAKLVRGQLSENEMIILRYNSLSEYGKKMQNLCNEYNLTKHLPIMKLLEFKKHYNVIKHKDEENHLENLNELVDGLDTMFIMLRKYAKNILDTPAEQNILYENCIRYTIKMGVTENRKHFNFELTKNTKNRRGGGKRLSATEKALDCFNDEQLEELFRDFLSELFNASNFYRYNNKLNVNKGVYTLDGDNKLFLFTIQSQNEIILSLNQATDVKS